MSEDKKKVWAAQCIATGILGVCTFLAMINDSPYTVYLLAITAAIALGVPVKRLLSQMKGG